jgi:hypothetical protein
LTSPWHVFSSPFSARNTFTRGYEKAQGANRVVLKAMGRAINKAVTIAEILKRKMPLHQITLLTSSEIIDVSFE